MLLNIVISRNNDSKSYPQFYSPLYLTKVLYFDKVDIMKDIDWNKKENKQLIEAILSLENNKEVQSFLRDLMTVNEINEFSNRLEAARLLSRNTQYYAIIKKTGLSSTTIARIPKWLRGPLGGYRLTLNRLSNMHQHNLTKKLGKGLSLSV